MSTVKELHDRAMVLSGEAFVARLRGELEKARELSRQALPFEAEAASMLEDRFDAEPSRSVLFRSAASLALQCGEYEEAKRLIATGLAGNPPAEIAAELRDVLKLVKQAEKQEQNNVKKDTLSTQAKKHTA